MWEVPSSSLNGDKKFPITKNKKIKKEREDKIRTSVGLCMYDSVVEAIDVALGSFIFTFMLRNRDYHKLWKLAAVSEPIILGLGASSVNIG